MKIKREVTESFDVEIDVDLNEFSTTDLMDEICDRHLSESEIDEFKDHFIENNNELIPEPETMVDEMKMEVFAANFQKKTVAEIEAFFAS